MAYVTLSPPLCYPEPMHGNSYFVSTTVGTNTVLDAADEKIGMVFRAPKAGTLDKCLFRVTAVGTPGNVKCSFQGTDGAGMPDLTEDQSATVAISTTGVVESGSLVDGGSAKRVVTLDEVVCVVLRNLTGNYTIAGLNSSNSDGRIHTYGFTALGGAAPTVATAAIGANFGVSYVTDGYELIRGAFPGITAAAYTFNTGSASQDEACSKWVAPWDCKCVGAYFAMDSDGDLKIVLQKATAYLDDKVGTAFLAVNRAAANNAFYFVNFDEFEILKDEVWFINARPTTGTNSSVPYIDVYSGAEKAAKMIAAHVAHTKNNGAAYATGVAPTEVTGRYFSAGLILSAINTYETPPVVEAGGTGFIQRLGI